MDIDLFHKQPYIFANCFAYIHNTVLLGQILCFGQQSSVGVHVGQNMRVLGLCLIVSMYKCTSRLKLQRIHTQY